MTAEGWGPTAVGTAGSIGPGTELCLVGWGCITPLGLDAMESAFGFRARASALGQCSIVDPSGAIPSMATCPLLDPFQEGVQRLFPLLESAIRESLAPLAARLSGRSVVVYLLADEARQMEGAGQDPAEALAIAARDLVRSLLQTRARIEVDTTGAAGLGEVLKRASTELISHTAEVAIVCAAHTDHERACVSSLYSHRRLHSADVLDGMILGEMAGTLVFCTAQVARNLQLSAVARIASVEVAMEKARWSNDESAYEALGLTMAARRATERHAQLERKIGWISSNASLEVFQMAELQAVLSRLQPRLGAPQVLDLPAHRIGNLGAASGVWQLIYAAEAFLRRFAPAAELLCLLGSESGGRAGILATSDM